MSRAPNLKRCQFCEEPRPEAVCDWPELRVIRIRPVAAVVGDLMQMGAKSYPITDIETVDNGFHLELDTAVQRAAFLHREFGDHYEKPITYADALTPSDRSRLIEILKDVKAGQR